MLSREICNQMYSLAKEKPGQDVWQNYDGVKTLVVQNPQSAAHILSINERNYRKRLDWLRQGIGRSRVSENGEEWSYRRELSHPHLTAFDRDKACLVAKKRTHEVLPTIIAHSRAGNITLDDDHFRQITMQVLAEIFICADLDTVGVEPALIGKIMTECSHFAFVSPGGADTSSPKSKKTITSTRLRLLNQLQNFRRLDTPAGSILEKMQRTDSDPQKGFILEQELLAFFAAGSESSAATLGWASYLLARDIALQMQLRQSIRHLEEDFTWQDVNACNLLKAFLIEAIRLYPPAPLVTREALHDDVVGNINLPARQLVIVSFIGTSHAPGIRHDPWEVDLKSAARGPCAGHRMPFSIGPRICGGKQFALVELMAILATMLKSVRFELTDPSPPRFHWQTQLLREGGQPVTIHPLDINDQRFARSNAAAMAPAG